MLLQVSMPAPGGADFMVWLGCLGLVLVLVDVGLRIKNSMFPKSSETRVLPSPLDIEGEIKVLPKGRRFSVYECEEKHKTLNERLAALDNYARAEVDRLHDKVDLVERRQNDRLAAAMNEIKETLRKMPAEIMVLINDAANVKIRREP